MFKTLDGKTWAPKLTIGIARKIQRETELNLLDLRSVANLANNLDTFITVTWYMIEDQAKERDISEQDFVDQIDGDMFEDISKEVLQAVINFFPKKKKEPLMRLLNLVNLQEEAVIMNMETIVSQMEAGLGQTS